jgi:hypothetical protein
MIRDKMEHIYISYLKQKFKMKNKLKQKEKFTQEIILHYIKIEI